jgi:hypothetical protein
MKFRHTLLASACGLALTTVTALASASSHREAPAIGFDPAADNTDVWAWVTPGTHDKLNVVVAYNPLEEPSGGPNYHEFSDDVLYEIHITRGTSDLSDVTTYQIQFDSNAYPRVDAADLTKPLGGGKEFFSQLSGRTQTYTLSKIVSGGRRVQIAKGIPVAPVNAGPRTSAVAYKIPAPGKYDDAFAATFIKDLGPDGRVWAGPRDDGFYVDIGRIFDLANVLTGTPRDNVAGFNCHAIALEIPTALLTKDNLPPAAGASNDNTLGVWASASRRQYTFLRRNGKSDFWGPWIQVSRLGLPLVNEALIGLQDKDRYNRSKPASDVPNFGAYFLNPVIVRDAEAVGIYNALSVPQATVDALKSNRLDVIDTINLTNFPTAGAHAIPLSATGDVLRVDLGLDSAFPNGRPIPGPAPNKEGSDVTDVLLSVLLAKGTLPVSDGVNSNDKNYLTTFPYLPLPWEGFSEGHGKPAP